MFYDQVNDLSLTLFLYRPTGKKVGDFVARKWSYLRFSKEGFSEMFVYVV